MHSIWLLARSMFFKPKTWKRLNGSRSESATARWVALQTFIGMFAEKHFWIMGHGSGILLQSIPVRKLSAWQEKRPKQTETYLGEWKWMNVRRARSDGVSTSCWICPICQLVCQAKTTILTVYKHRCLCIQSNSLLFRQTLWQSAQICRSVRLSLAGKVV